MAKITNKIKNFNEYKDEKHLSLYISTFIALIFSIYNLYLGIKYNLIWNLTISAYYLLLLGSKTIISLHNFKVEKKGISYSFTIFVFVSILCLLITLVMIGPAVLMIHFERNVNVGTIAAISIATYTFYKLGVSIYGYSKYKKDKNLFKLQVFIINLLGALVSILTLQNTLISVFSDNEETLNKMNILTTISSILILLGMAVIVIISLRKGIMMNNEAKEK
jgi:hypothetical protein